LAPVIRVMQMEYRYTERLLMSSWLFEGNQ